MSTRSDDALRFRLPLTPPVRFMTATGVRVAGKSAPVYWSPTTTEELTTILGPSAPPPPIDKMNNDSKIGFDCHYA